MIRTKPNEREKRYARNLFDSFFKEGGRVPVAFFYGGEKQAGFAGVFSVTRRERQNEPRTEVELTARFCETDLRADIRAAYYPDYASIEWVLTFHNDGEEDTYILSDIASAAFELAGGDPVLRHYRGDSHDDPDAYRPLVTPLKKGALLDLAPKGGRGSNKEFPYYNLEYGPGGAIFAVGWPGQWFCRFENTGSGVRVEAGQENVATVLHPGESFRSPLFALLFYDGRDEARAQNLWRRWFIDCNMRKPGGELFPPVMSASTSWLYEEMAKATDDNQIAAIRAYHENGIKLDYWWMDAGWYYLKTGVPIQSWVQTGTWEMDIERFPSCMKAVSDYAGTLGAKTLLWFEPERAENGSYLYDEKPEWLLGGKLIDFSNLGFRRWMTERADAVLTEGGISLYRQDFNMDPLPYWRAADEPDRRGMTENKHVCGYLAYWDELISRHPRMMLDSCASGGRRNDLETMRRSIPIHKTDADYSDYARKQGMHHTLYKWFPYFGTPVTNGDPKNYKNIDEYALRSAFVPWICHCADVNDPQTDYATLKKYSDEWREVNGCFYGEYYPLTDWSNSEGWIGWQFAEGDAGLIQLYRRQTGGDDAITIYPQGLDPEKDYIFTFLGEDKDDVTLSGAKALKAGLAAASEPKKAVLIKYRAK